MRDQRSGRWSLISRSMRSEAILGMSLGAMLGLSGLGLHSADAQVFDIGPAAEMGVVTPGTGEGFYGNFGLNAPSNVTQSFGVYRRLDEIDRPGTSQQVHTFTPVTGNASAALWEGLDHGGSGTQSGYHDPGMFLGNDRSRSSYNHQLLYFGPTKNGTGPTDRDGGVGGDNLPNGTTIADSNRRVNWEVAVGFMEDVDSYMGSRPPNSDRMDLWDGPWNTDGVSMRLFFTASNSPQVNTTEWFSFQETNGGTGTGLRLQSGSPDTTISDESDRNVYPSTRRRAGSGTILSPATGFLAGGENGRAVPIGVNYNDRMELTWKMELNDPVSTDPVKAREVRFTAKTGNLEYISVFDPGFAGSNVVPNPTNDPDSPWDGGFFDWRNAKPVFYVGLDDGTDYGASGATGLMGIFIPGDFNADGKVDNSDRSILQANLGSVDSSYSRGDLDQDGDTDQTDLLAWQNVGDFNAQIDAIRDVAERIKFVRNYVPTWMGDSNLDGRFDTNDLVFTFQKGEYEDATVGNSRWADGDWNGDYEFNSNDFIVAFQDGGFERGPVGAIAAVPEPSACLLVLMGLASWLGRHRLRFPVK